MHLTWIIAAATGLASGTGIATTFTLPLAVAFFLTLIAFVSILYSFRSTHETTSFIRIVVLGLLFCALGIALVDYAETQFGQSPLVAQVGSAVTLQGVIVREPDERAKATYLYLQTNDTLVLVSVDRFSTVRYGDTITVEGSLKQPQSFTTDFGRTFDYPGYLKAKGVEYTVSFATVTVTKRAEPSFIGSLLLFKQSFINQLESVIPEPYAALANGLLLGMKQGLGEELARDFQKAGLTHIVVLSGYNVMLIVTFVTFLLALVLPPRPRLLVGIGLIVSFALMVGLSATVVRASIMAALFLIAQTLGRTYAVLRALLLAGMVMVLVNPYLIVYDVGFQLSFTATLGLILALPYFKAPGQPETIGLTVKGYVVSTIATQIAVLPLLAYHIGEVSVVSVVVNVLTLPMVPVAMLLSFMATIISIISLPVATILGFFASLSLGYIITMAALFADLAFATVTIPPILPILVFAGYVVLGLGYYFITQRKKITPLHGWTIIEEK